MSHSSPDENATGLLAVAPDPRRYDGHTDDPLEVAGLLGSLAPKNGRILDVGCGTGSVSRIVAGLSGSTVVGVEPDASRAAVAASRGLEVHSGFLHEELLPKLGKFDAIMFADVLEHLDQPAALLNLALGALAPGGVVLISVPNVAHWTVRWDLLRGRWRYAEFGIMDATHLRWFTADSIIHLCRSCGLAVQEYRLTAGVTLPDYSRRLFWRRLPDRARRRIIHCLLRLFPQLFGCQHVVRAALRPVRDEQLGK